MVYNRLGRRVRWLQNSDSVTDLRCVCDHAGQYGGVLTLRIGASTNGSISGVAFENIVVEDNPTPGCNLIELEIDAHPAALIAEVSFSNVSALDSRSAVIARLSPGNGTEAGRISGVSFDGVTVNGRPLAEANVANENPARATGISVRPGRRRRVLSRTVGGVPLKLDDTAPAKGGVVNASTLTHTFMMGYQGWYATPCDGSGVGWSHWSANNRTPGPDPGHQGFLRFDSWPDMTEFDADELCPTNLRYANGSTAGLYSAANAKTVARHFRWMADYGVDGVWKQRFLCDVGEAGPKRDFNDRVTQNVRAAALASGRVWAMMYLLRF